jgi:hypothetical protein
MVFKKCSPRLRGWVLVPFHILRDRGLSSSPWILGAPQPTFADCIWRISLRISGAIGGRPRRLLFRVQYQRKPCRCHRTTVSGVTIRSNARQRDEYLESKIQNRRSIGEKRGRLTERSSTASCWRRMRFSSRRVRRVLNADKARQKK